jgi:CAAX prenyl protease-like protein
MARRLRPLERVAVVAIALAAWGLLHYALYPLKARLHFAVVKGLGGQGGPERFVAHAFTFWLPSTLGYLGVWLLLSRIGWMDSPRVLLTAGPHPRRSVVIGLVAGAVTIALGFGSLLAGHKLSFHPSGWLMAGNLFSNLYEEIEYRGFLYYALLAASDRPLLAILGASVLFGIVHGPNPVMMVGAGLVGAIFALAYRRSGSLLAPWIGHQISDMVLDALL